MASRAFEQPILGMRQHKDALYIFKKDGIYKFTWTENRWTKVVGSKRKRKTRGDIENLLNSLL